MQAPGILPGAASLLPSVRERESALPTVSVMQNHQVQTDHWSMQILLLIAAVSAVAFVVGVYTRHAQMAFRAALALIPAGIGAYYTRKFLPLKNLEGELEDLRQINRRLQENNALLLQGSKDFRKQIKAMRLARKGLVDKIESLSDEEEELGGQVDRLGQARRATELLHEHVAETKEGLQAQVVALQAEIERYRAALETTQGHLRELAKRISAIQGNTEAIGSHTAAIDEQTDELERLHQEGAAMLQQMWTALEHFGTQREALLQEVRLYKEAAGAINTEGLEAQTKDLTATLERLEKAVKRAEELKGKKE